MELKLEGAPIYFTIPVLGGIDISATLVVTWGVMIVLTGFCIYLTRDLKVNNISRRQAVAEKLVTLAENFVRGSMGEKGMPYLYLIVTILSLSVMSSLSSLLGLWPPTADICTCLAWSIVALILITYTKFKTNGVIGVIKDLCSPFFLMAPFNLLGDLFRPIAMAFRHFGNILSGIVISGLIYWALANANHALFTHLFSGALGEVLGAIPFLSVGVPAILSVYFDWFTAAMQAYIFCMLTMMYIANAAGD